MHKEQEKEKEKEKERGIKAIIGLQAAAGITETREQASAGWDGMSLSERRSTLQAADAILPEGWDSSLERRSL